MSQKRAYAVLLEGSSVPIHVAVPIDDDHEREQHAAIMFAREKAEPWQRPRILRGCERGPIVEVLDE